MRTDTGQVINLADYRPTDFVLERVDLTFELDPTATKVDARLIFHRRKGADPKAPLVLDGDELALAGLLFDQKEMKASQYTATPESLTIRNLPKAKPFELTITTIINPEANTKLMGLYRTNGVYCTQCEAEGFRRITYFPDRPDVMAPYTITIEATRPPTPVMLSNGNFLGGAGYDEGPLISPPGSIRIRSQAISSRWSPVTSVSSKTRSSPCPRREVDAEDLCRARQGSPRRLCDGFAEALDEVGRGALRPQYDLDVFMIVAVSDFNMGAMENKGLNVFNDKYVLADPETATDADYANIEAIIAHEYFHNWTGNRITCRDWFQLCLKEGLTVFRDHEFSADSARARSSVSPKSAT
jgi:aminopeptidase N